MDSGYGCAPGLVARSLRPVAAKAAPSYLLDTAFLMLAAAHRMRRPADFRLTIARGIRVSRSTLTLHYMRGQSASSIVQVPRIGFVVSRAVGNAVARNRVKRRLRAQIRGFLPILPQGVSLVVRARPLAATASSAAIAADLRQALLRLGREL